MGRTYRLRRRRRDKIQQLDVKTDISRSLGGLAQLCVSHGCTSIKNLRPYNFFDGGRGLQTLTSILPGQTLIRLPSSLLITTSVAIRDPQIKSAINRTALKPTAAVLLCTFLLLERCKGGNSPWVYYIQSVPTIYSTLLYMNGADIQFLDVGLRAKYDAIKESVDRTFQEVKMIFSSVLEPLSYGDILWAWHVVNTRSVFMEQPYLEEVRTSAQDKNHFALAPFLDLLNHTHTAQVKAGYNEASRCYEIVTYDSYKRYDQVYISYGAHSNRTLLLEYGFCIRGNVHNYIEFTPESLLECLDVPIDLKSSVCRELTKNSMSKGLICDASGFSWNLVEAIKIISQKTGVSSSGNIGRLVCHSVDRRQVYLNDIRNLRSSHAQRTSNELFILEMLTVLYEDEITLLVNAERVTEVTWHA